MSKRVWGPKRLKKIREMIKGGASFGDVAKHFGVSRSTIAGVTFRNGIKSKNAFHNPRSFDYDRARLLSDNGVSCSAIALHFGVHEQTVFRAIRIARGQSE